MKNSADLGGRYISEGVIADRPRPRWITPSASVDNTLLDLQNSSSPTRPHSIIAKYMRVKIPRTLASAENFVKSCVDGKRMTTPDRWKKLK